RTIDARPIPSAVTPGQTPMSRQPSSPSKGRPDRTALSRTRGNAATTTPSISPAIESRGRLMGPVLRASCGGTPGLRPHRRRRVPAVVDPDPAVLRVAPRGGVIPTLAELAELVRLDGVPRRLRVDAEELRGVQAQDLVLDLGRELGIFELLDQSVGD